MPPPLHATSVGMMGVKQVQRWDLVWALPASLALHALLAVLLIYGLPMPSLQTQEDEPVSVTFVPPADEPKPVPPPPPRQPEAEKPPEPKVEKPPEPKVEKPPEQKAEKPPEPKVEKPPEPKAEKPPPPPPAKEQPKPSPIEVLKPVFEFGEKDAGPRKSLNGSSARDNSPSPAKDDVTKPPVPANSAEAESEAAPGDSAEAKTEAAPGSEQQPDAAETADKQAAPDKQATPDQTATQQTDEQAALAVGADEQAGSEPAPLADDGEIALPAMAEVPQPKPIAAPPRVKFSKPGGGSAKASGSKGLPAAAPQRYSGLPGVRVLRSDVASGDAGATTAMAGIPRDQRVAKLCASELQQKLVSASYFPNLVPLIPLKSGDVLDIPDAAFRMQSTWYNLSFRCEVDPDATRVLSFSFNVGNTIPPEQWGGLGLPN